MTYGENCRKFSDKTRATTSGFFTRYREITNTEGASRSYQ